MRCFVAVDLSPDVRAALEDECERLRAVAPRADVRWVRVAGMHLTLKFLGEVPEKMLAGIRNALSAAATATPPMVLACTGLGVFPGSSKPRVVWAGITEGLQDLGRLAAAVDRAVEPFGFAPERRPFRGHVTLARVRSPRGVRPLARAVEVAGCAPFGSWSASHVVLYRSRLHPTGAVYEPLATLPLAGTVA
jgi:RNA 2',3'-cyclic 3'-phosphodiesterase